ncbi:MULTISPECIES: MarR family winged helix-turn-helix transcriptional regulator [Microbacterium]|uniref:MarR family winged helix-turn-helix transcriptional regulator n=1 Tax=Microbacterium TaxID=33882 RepID=UPI001CBFEE5C|nr:hypothetical protein [Microbacterium sp. OVT16B]
MNTSDNTQNPRPFGYWITATDRLMAAEFATAFEREGASRRDWRLLNVIDGTVPASRPLHPGKVRALVERGWVEQTADGWTLTDDGRAAKERLAALVDNIRATVTDAVSPDDLATTLATLEQIARAFGWDENTPLPRRRGGRGFGRRHGHPFGRGRGFGPFRGGFGPGFGPGFRAGFGPGFGPGDEHGDDCGHAHAHRHGADAEHGHDSPAEHRRGFDGGRGHRFAPEFGHGRPHHGHGDHRAARAAQHAYERGFDAGYSRGRDA